MEDIVKETIKDAIKVLPEYTPYYIMDEVQHYFNKINAGKSDCFTLDNAISLVNLSKSNNGVTEEQAQKIKESIRKIKNN